MKKMFKTTILVLLVLPTCVGMIGCSSLTNVSYNKGMKQSGYQGVYEMSGFVFEVPSEVKNSALPEEKMSVAMMNKNFGDNVYYMYNEKEGSYMMFQADSFLIYSLRLDEKNIGSIENTDDINDFLDLNFITALSDDYTSSNIGGKIKYISAAKFNGGSKFKSFKLDAEMNGYIAMIQEDGYDACMMFAVCKDDKFDEEQMLYMARSLDIN